VTPLKVNVDPVPFLKAIVVSSYIIRWLLVYVLL
jgi:hypothetical protein